MSFDTGTILFVGIDEAGYGPLLGPLVVSAAAFEVPAVDTQRSLWDLLSPAVTTAPRPRDRRISICDSKKLHRPNDGIAPIERTALAAFAAWRDLPSDLRGLLSHVAPHVIDQLDHYPWHRSCPPLPLAADPGGVRLAAESLRRCYNKCGVRSAGFWCEPLFEEHYNRKVNATQNKAAVLLSLTLRLIQRVGEAHPNRDIYFFIDKQGGRGHYASLLMLAFEDVLLRVVEESPEVSRYSLKRPGGSWHIDFLVQGDAKQLPISLASILSKYLREVCMTSFNDFWKVHLPAIAPTAGYYVDGMRFLSEVSPYLERLGIDRRLMVRER